ncbi:MAG: hypothetical protein WCI71_09995 [Bacteroidota bacterium]
MEYSAITLSTEQKEKFDHCISLIHQREMLKEELKSDYTDRIDNEIEAINKRLKYFLISFSAEEYPVFINRLRLSC